jgi:hypothetical protein
MGYLEMPMCSHSLTHSLTLEQPFITVNKRSHAVSSPIPHGQLLLPILVQPHRPIFAEPLTQISALISIFSSFLSSLPYLIFLSPSSVILTPSNAASSRPSEQPTPSFPTRGLEGA